MIKDRKSITTNGRAAFYACIYPDLLKIALDCGWALGLHGSLTSDFDIMAMAWTEDAKPIEDLIKSLCELFIDNPYLKNEIKPFTDKPKNRIVYTIPIWADFYLDINVIKGNF